jgi:hypothetical protein
MRRGFWRAIDQEAVKPIANRTQLLYSPANQSSTPPMNAHLHLDDDLAHYLSEQAKQEHTTLDVVLNRLLRRVLPGKAGGEPMRPPTLTSKPMVTLVRDAQTGRMVLARKAGLPPITTEMVSDILNELA